MPRPDPRKFDGQTQLLIAVFGYFIAFPVFDIPFIGISVTFPIFLLIYQMVSGQVDRVIRVTTLLDRLMLWFILAAALSIFLAPPVDRMAEQVFVKDLKSFLYLAYWYSVYLFFKEWYSRIDLKLLSIAFLFGVFCSAMLILVGSRKGSSSFYGLGPVEISQNGFAFNTIACMGIGCWYVFQRYRLRGFLILSVFFLFAELKSGSRAGGLLIIAQFSLFLIVILFRGNLGMRRALVKLALVLVVCFPFFGAAVSFTGAGAVLAGWVAPYSPDLAEFLRDPEKAKERDKPLLVRRVLIDKGVDLFQKHPVTGIGWGHFKYVRADIDVKKYKYLQYDYDYYALSRSSHNSYIRVLSETGIIGMIPFVLVQLLVLKRVVHHFMSSEAIAGPCILGISLLGVAAYFWVVAAVTGAVWYAVLGLFAGADKAVGVPRGVRGRYRAMPRRRRRRLQGGASRA